MLNRTIITFSFCISQLIFAQSESQIKQAKEMFKKSGMTKSQAIQEAKSRGYNQKQIDAAIAKSEKAKIGQVDELNNTEEINIQNLGTLNNANSSPNSNSNNTDIISNFSNSSDELPIINEQELDFVTEEENFAQSIQTTSNDGNYFGYEIFSKDPAIFQASSVGAVDPDYLIGPGDEIIAMLWGETEFRQVLTVNREGFVFIPEIGQVFVNGLNLNLLESKLFKVFSKSYASLNPNGKKATTFLDISLGNLRPLRIQVLGQVSQPGAYTVSPSTTLFSSLYYFNGPKVSGSLRDVRLIRNGDQISSIDFYDYLLTGRKPMDEKLQLDDVIFIPNRIKTVSIFGEVNRPGIFELREKEDLKDIINMSGGLKITAYLDRAQIDRIVPFEKREEIGMDRMYTDVDLGKIINSLSIFELQDGDKIQVFSVLGLRQNVVNLKGAVTRPGTYDLGDSLKLSQLIQKADDLLGDAYMDRLDIVRLKSDFTEKLIKLNLSEALSGNPEHDILLKGMDQIRVYSMTEMVPRTYVSISGHVKRAGRYLLQENMTLYDLIFKAGGYIDEEFKKRTYLDRAELVRKLEDSDVKEIIPFHLGQVLKNQDFGKTVLRPDDAVRIYSITEIKGDTRYVTIKGNVKRPGRYELFENNMTIHDLIFISGGFEDIEFKKTTYLERADLIRYDDDRINKKVMPFNLGRILEDKSYKGNLILKPGDEINLYPNSVFNEMKSVIISGSIRKPGSYGYKLDMTLKDLILEAGGVIGDVYKYKVEIARIDPLATSDDDFAKAYTFDMDNDFLISKHSYLYEEIIAKDSVLILKPYDQVYLRPNPYFVLQKKVSIIGEVYYPGEYVILNPDERVSDLINRAGGLRKNAFIEGSRFSRGGTEVLIDLKNLIKKPNSKYDINIQPGDQLFIATKPGIYSVFGQVNVPGTYKFTKGLRIKDVIEFSGGYTNNSDKQNIYITYPNGLSKKYRRFFGNHTVLDGSRITIGLKPEEEPFDRTEFYKEITTIFANLAQAVSLLLIAKG